MGLETYQVARDHFEPDDDSTHLAFPCCACRHRHGTDKEEPCIRCDWNLAAKGDDELPPNANMTGELARFLPDLIAALGGEVQDLVEQGEGSPSRN